MSQLWITWEKQRRNLGISSEIGFQLYEIISKKKVVGRYLECIVKTIVIIWNTKPTHIVVQNPSIVLALLAVIMKWFYRFTLVVDSHNAGIYPLDGRLNILNSISKFIQRNSDYTIVTNENLKKVVELNGGVACVLPDKIPVPPETPHKELEGQLNVCFICTYALDEPYAEVIKSAEYIPTCINILITGNYANKVDPATLPNNIRLLGYLSEENYWATLRSSDVVMDLTTRSDCLVCGAYEGVSLNKPLILSNTEASRSYFYKGCVYVDSDANSIASGISCAVNNIAKLRNEVFALKDELEEKWGLYVDNLKAKINSKPD